MSRTDELASSGAKQIGGGGNAPFVKWGDNRSYVEGRVLNLWESQYGMNARIAVEKASSGLEASSGKGEPRVRVEPGMEVNVGLNYTALAGLTEDQVGHDVHVAFEGWVESKSGNDYRNFRVFDLGGAGETRSGKENATERSEEQLEPSARMKSRQASGGGPGAPGSESPPPPGEDDLPF